MKTLVVFLVAFLVIAMAFGKLRRSLDGVLLRLFATETKASIRLAGLLSALVFASWCWATFDLAFRLPSETRDVFAGADTSVFPKWAMPAAWWIAAYCALACFLGGFICAMSPPKAGSKQHERC